MAVLSCVCPWVFWVFAPPLGQLGSLVLALVPTLWAMRPTLHDDLASLRMDRAKPGEEFYDPSSKEYQAAVLAGFDAQGEERYSHLTGQQWKELRACSPSL